jgi:hypothetical protein
VDLLAGSSFPLGDFLFVHLILYRVLLPERPCFAASAGCTMRAQAFSVLVQSHFSAATRDLVSPLGVSSGSGFLLRFFIPHGSPLCRCCSHCGSVGPLKIKAFLDLQASAPPVLGFGLDFPGAASVLLLRVDQDFPFPIFCRRQSLILVVLRK